MAASRPVTDSRKRPRASHGFSAESFCLDFGDGVSSPCNKRWAPETIRRKISPSSSSSSSVQPACVSSSSAIPLAHEDIGFSSSRSHESSVPVSSSASALTDTADSTPGTALLPPLPHECSLTEQQLLCCASYDQEAESCCGGNDTSELDITCFLLHEVWEDTGSEGGDAFAFNPDAIYLNGGTSTDCSEDATFADCSAENGNWFLNDLESQGHAFLNEVLDQEWMAAAVANIDRFNDTLDADLCVLHLLESDDADKGY